MGQYITVWDSTKLCGTVHNHTRRSVCSVYPRSEKVFGPCLRRSMRRTKWTGSVAPAIARFHSCLFITMWEFKGAAHWVRMSMWDDLWLLTEVNASTIVRIPGIVRRTESCWRQRAELCIQTEGEYFCICETRRVLIAGVAAGSALHGCDSESLAEQLATFRKIVAAFSLTTQRHVFMSVSCVCGSHALVLRRNKYMRSKNTTLLLVLSYHVTPCTASKAIVRGNWLSFRYVIVIVIIIILVITFLYGNYNYIPCFYGTQCCSCSVFTVCATCSVISHAKCFVLLH
jgi:hypothetical protein